MSREHDGLSPDFALNSAKKGGIMKYQMLMLAAAGLMVASGAVAENAATASSSSASADFFDLPPGTKIYSVEDYLPGPGERNPKRKSLPMVEVSVKLRLLVGDDNMFVKCAVLEQTPTDVGDYGEFACLKIFGYGAAAKQYKPGDWITITTKIEP